ncbi:NADPH-dependent FMN reductase [Yinghuangia aomiensis]
MSSVLVLWGSPSGASRTGAVAAQVADRLAAAGHRVDRLAVRDLPAEALLHADFADPAVRDAIARVERADALVSGEPRLQGRLRRRAQGVPGRPARSSPSAAKRCFRY